MERHQSRGFENATGHKNDHAVGVTRCFHFQCVSCTLAQLQKALHSRRVNLGAREKQRAASEKTDGANGSAYFVCRKNHLWKRTVASKTLASSQDGRVQLCRSSFLSCLSHHWHPGVVHSSHEAVCLVRYCTTVGSLSTLAVVWWGFDQTFLQTPWGATFFGCT